jgi:pyruvate-ferredoxin/flavodoxin oxidoreductase
VAEVSYVTIDGNEAAAQIAYHANELILVYPIVPAAAMGEWVDGWAAAGRKNFLGTVPRVVQMQGEGGVAGALHGALQAGGLATTFTASQGLLLMAPDMYRIAGGLLPAVIHVAARAITTHAASLYGDHSDVMGVRQTGWAMLASNSVQETQDFALVAQAATLATRVPFVHFFDGFRTSHEINKIIPITRDEIAAFLDLQHVQAQRQRALDPDRPVLRGTTQLPEVFFANREASAALYRATAGIVQRTMDRLAALCGRRYRLFDYSGHPEAERALVLMGSGAEAAEEAVAQLVGRGEKVGLVKVRLFRPFDTEAFLACLPGSLRRLAVLDRTREPGASGEPLLLDVLAATVRDASADRRIQVIGGRYGLGSCEFTPAMAARVLEELSAPTPRRTFTIGIVDDAAQLSLDYEEAAFPEAPEVLRAVCYGVSGDGSSAANRLTLRIIGAHASLYVQGYATHDGRLAKGTVVFHLRFSSRPIQSSYRIQQAGFVSVSSLSLLERSDALHLAQPGATLLINAPGDSATLWRALPPSVQQTIREKQLRLYAVDAHALARDAGTGENIGTIMQTCFLWLSHVLPRAQAIDQIKQAIQQAFSRRGRSVVEQHMLAADRAIDHIQPVGYPPHAGDSQQAAAAIDSRPYEQPRAGLDPSDPPALAAPAPLCWPKTDGFSPPLGAPSEPAAIGTRTYGLGERIPTSALPVDGTFATGSVVTEKRGLAQAIPVWIPELCTECGLCSLVCPHAAIRIKAYDGDILREAPDSFASRPAATPWLEGRRLSVQVLPDDCTGCGVCVDVCPGRSKEVARSRAINMAPKEEHAGRERVNYRFFQQLPDFDRTRVPRDTQLGSQLLRPLFEFSTACPGCGETPYLKLVSQLFGDRALVANATGCSSIYGGYSPGIPWSRDAAGRGPAWASSLLEDNAEFGLGMRLALDQRRQQAARLLKELHGTVDADLARSLLQCPQSNDAEIAAQRVRLDELRRQLATLDRPEAAALSALADALLRRSVWIVGGDGWAYDIGFGGLDHVLRCGQDVNVLVLDNGLYSSTGGQLSKATPRAAVAKFATAGQGSRRKDLGHLAMTYRDVYVAQVAIGADPQQTLRAMLEAESYAGPSLVLAYSQCVVQGINMTTAMSHQKQIVQCGLWPGARKNKFPADSSTARRHLRSCWPKSGSNFSSSLVR